MITYQTISGVPGPELDKRLNALANKGWRVLHMCAVQYQYLNPEVVYVYLLESHT